MSTYITKTIASKIIELLAGNLEPAPIIGRLWPGTEEPAWVSEQGFAMIALMDQLTAQGLIDFGLEYGATAIEVRSALQSLIEALDIDIRLPWLEPNDPDCDTDDHLAAYAQLLAGQGWALICAIDAESRQLMICDACEGARTAALLDFNCPFDVELMTDDLPADFAASHYQIVDETPTAPAPHSIDARSGTGTRAARPLAPFVPFRRGPAWGICSPDRHMLVDANPQWSYVSMPLPLTDDCWIAEYRVDALHGLISFANGTLHITPAVFSETGVFDFWDAPPAGHLRTPALIAVRDPKSRLWGYVTPDGTLALDFAYDKAEPFVDGLAVVSCKDRWSKSQHLISPDGNPVTQTAFGMIDSPACGLWLVRQSVRGSGPRYGFVAPSGTVAVEPRFFDAQPFSHGLARVETASPRHQRRVAIIDPQGHAVLTALEDALPAQADHIAIKRAGRWEVVDHQGNPLFKTNFGDAQNLGAGRLALRRGGWRLYAPDTHGDAPLSETTHEHFSRRGFLDGRCAVAGKGVLHIDLDGTPRTPVGVSDLMEDFYAGRSQIMRYADGLSGYIDINGAEVIPRKYQHTSDFHPLTGLAHASTERELPSGGYIDTEGHEFWQN